MEAKEAQAARVGELFAAAVSDTWSWIVFLAHRTWMPLTIGTAAIGMDAALQATAMRRLWGPAPNSSRLVGHGRQLALAASITLELIAACSVAVAVYFYRDVDERAWKETTYVVWVATLISIGVFAAAIVQEIMEAVDPSGVRARSAQVGGRGRYALMQLVVGVLVLLFWKATDQKSEGKGEI